MPPKAKKLKVVFGNFLWKEKFTGSGALWLYWFGLFLGWTKDDYSLFNAVIFAFFTTVPFVKFIYKTEFKKS